MAKTPMVEVQGPGGRQWVDESRVDEYLARPGYKECKPGKKAAEKPVEEPVEETPESGNESGEDSVIGLELSKDDVNGMKKSELKAFASERGFDVSGMNASEMKTEIIHQLDLQD